MKLNLAYGQNGMVVEMPPDANVTVITGAPVAPLKDDAAALREALRQPIGARPLRELVNALQSVAIVFSDITRPAPSHLMIPAILDELSHVPRERIVLCNALGTHRPNTREELCRMLGAGLVDQFRIEQNNCTDPSTQVCIGTSSRGHEQWINRVYMEADVKILTGFIEPHFFAGFSGGGKSVMPGMAGQKTVLGNHDAGMIADPRSTWGVTRGNPIWEEARETALRTKPTFILNVALNRQHQITGVFAGALEAAHDAGIEFVKKTAMVPVTEPFDMVVTTNSGYPLDQNLYQCGKGMSAAERIVRKGGAIVMAAKCEDGIPDHGLYRELLLAARNPTELFEQVLRFPKPRQDQWAAQIQARIQLHADVHLFAEGLTDQQIRESLLIPSRDIAATIEQLRARYGRNARIGVLPDGPQTIAYLTNGAGKSS